VVAAGTAAGRRGTISGRAPAVESFSGGDALVIFPQKVKWLRGKEFPGMPENGPSPAPGRSWRRGLRAALLLLSLWLCGCAILHDGPANTVPTVSDHGAPASTPAVSVPTPGASVIAPDAPVPAAAIFPEAPGEGGSRQTGAAVCLPEFPDRDGWYGGDGAYSIQLDDWRVLWLFGDTFVSEEEGRRDRTGMAVVLGTTVAVSTCAADDFRIRYRLKRKDGKFVSSFGRGNGCGPRTLSWRRGRSISPSLPSGPRRSRKAPSSSPSPGTGWPESATLPGMIRTAGLWTTSI